jgi:cyclase
VRKARTRIIPRLDIKGPNLVKGIHLEGLRVLGDPAEYARHYYSEGADELIYMDVVASLYDRNSLHEIIQLTSKEIFIPLTVGGGIRTLDDIEAVLKAGADKVSINTAGIKDPEFIRKASERFGSSTIVVSIEAKQKSDGSYEAYIDNGREVTGVDAFEWAKRVVDLGAGEILVTSIDKEGSGKGFDLELTKKIATGLPVPVIANGGGGIVEDVAEAIEKGCADAVAIASILHYETIKKFDHKDGGYNGMREFKVGTNRINPCSLEDVRKKLNERGIDCRKVEEENESA